MGIRDQRKYATDVCVNPIAAVTMLSRRAVTVLTLVTVSICLLLLTSRRLNDWSIDGTNYHPIPAPGIPPPSHGQGSNNATESATLETEDLPFRPHDPMCNSFPDTSNILLVMKTGATESFGKVPTQLMTMLKCLPEFFIFSDLDQRIAGYHIRDSLSTVLPEAMDGNKDFDLYRRQQACPIDQENCNKLAESSSEGWNLDKYKNVHIAEKTFKMRPNYDWYVFVDADTYVLWPTLVQWLRKLNPLKKHYLGSVTMINNFSFGHGGSGYIVSKAAMTEFLAGKTGVGNQWDFRASKECCGDYIFALALKNATDVGVKNTWPTINGEKPSTLPFGPSHWCHPIVTMHHMNSEEINMFWEYESRRYAAKNLPNPPPPMRIKDIYQEFFASKLKEVREDWDNLSDDRFYLNQTSRKFEEWEINRSKQDDLSDLEKKAHESFAACGEACESLKDCYQYRYQDGICGISWAFKLGVPKKRDNKESKRWMSGWDTKKINTWIKAQGECGSVKWPET